MNPAPTCRPCWPPSRRPCRTRAGRSGVTPRLGISPSARWRFGRISRIGWMRYGAIRSWNISCRAAAPMTTASRCFRRRRSPRTSIRRIFSVRSGPTPRSWRRCSIPRWARRSCCTVRPAPARARRSPTSSSTILRWAGACCSSPRRRPRWMSSIVVCVRRAWARSAWSCIRTSPARDMCWSSLPRRSPCRRRVRRRALPAYARR